MRSLGMVRKVDELGRIVLPIEIRRMMELNPGDGAEIFVEKKSSYFAKVFPVMHFLRRG